MYETDDILKGAMTSSDSFRVFAPLHVFEKADAPAGEQRRVAGVISTDALDRENERVLQEGLDFSEFLNFGWLNNNHKPDPSEVLGYPEHVRHYKKGETLPDGTKALSNCHWMEGHLIPGYQKADEVWNLARALQKTDGRRRLGYSIEGKILRRAGAANKIIANASVRNVAITHVPVNPETNLVALAKALRDAEVAPLESAAPIVVPAATLAAPVLSPPQSERDLALVRIAQALPGHSNQIALSVYELALAIDRSRARAA